MSATPKLVIITPTWAGDVDHFRVMRKSVEQSPLSAYDHYVVVQDEDMALFEEFRGRTGLHLLSTADVLPPAVERKRKTARNLSERFGRNITRLAGSLRRLLSWPDWPSYTGWHTQQLCKLKLGSELESSTVVVLDSDVVVTKAASCEDFLAPSRLVCFADWLDRGALRGKVRNWIEASEKLVGASPDQSPVNVYFDTPFVFDRDTLKKALQLLEESSGESWWNVLLACPPRRWSEFGMYKTYVGSHCAPERVEWRVPEFSRYIYNTSDSEDVVRTVGSMLVDPDVHYITIHSHASGRENWDPKTYLGQVSALLDSGT